MNLPEGFVYLGNLKESPDGHGRTDLLFAGPLQISQQAEALYGRVSIEICHQWLQRQAKDLGGIADVHSFRSSTCTESRQDLLISWDVFSDDCDYACLVRELSCSS